MKILGLVFNFALVIQTVECFVLRDPKQQRSRTSKYGSDVSLNDRPMSEATEIPPFSSDSGNEIDGLRLTGIPGSESWKGTRQAGTDGYSLIRQPLSRSNWDPTASPDYEAPLFLKDESPLGGFNSWDDEQWWKKSLNKAPEKPAQSSTAKKNIEMDRGKEDELDLFRRTFETLDYPRILRSLAEEHVTTLPARNIIFDKAPIAKHKESRAAIAFSPFLADNAADSCDRYREVQELECLLQGKTRDGTEISDDYFFRNRKGYKESLIGRSPPLEGNSFALEPMLQAAATGGLVLESPQLLEISRALDQMQIIQSWGEALTKVTEVELVELPKLANSIDLNETLHELLRSALDDEGRLSGVTFPDVGRLRARVKNLRGDIIQTLENLVRMPSIQSKLALESGGPLFSEINGGRLVIPLQASDSKRQVSSVGIVHDTSRSGKTLYVEPQEIVGPTNELRQAEGELRSEEARIWRYLTQQVLVNQRALEQSLHAIGQLDLVQARLGLGQSWNGIVPVVKEEGVIRLRDAKHPVLLLRKLENVVGSDIDLGVDGNQGLVLTGPNSGGKTVILKLLGLVALLARAGVPVPAAPGDYQARVDFFDPVLADIGDIQSVGGDLSTFSGHMLVCKQVLDNSGKNALVLMDELGSGTDPAQGVAIAQALLEAIVEKGARVAITTHYMQLKQLAASDNRFAVGGMQFVNGRPTYKLLPGTVGESFALAVAERLNLPKSVISRANELLDSDTRKMGDLIGELEDRKALLDAQVEEMEAKKREMAEMEFELKERQLNLERKQLTVRREETRKFAKMLEEKEKVLEDILNKLKADPSRKVVAKSWDEIKCVKRDALREAENVPSVLARKEKAAAAMEEASAAMIPISELGDEKLDLESGDCVIICKKGPLFSREATVVKVLSNQVEVRVNNMNVNFKLGEIALPSNSGTNRKKASVISSPTISKVAQRALAQEKQGEGKRRENEWEAARSALQTKESSDSQTVHVRTESNTIDVRGCTLVEAQEKVKEKFSMVLMQGRRNPVVYILHGHGTGGVLKSKIRQWLKTENRSVVKKWSAADPANGGDAFTRVELS